MSNGYHAADDGSLARSTGGAAARGAMLIALALVIGLVLMAFALDDPQTVIASTDDTTTDVESTDDAADTSTDDATEDSSDAVSVGEPDGSTDETVATIAPDDSTPDTIAEAPPTGEARPASEVNVLVANGTGGKGVAGTISDKLKADGYIANAANAPSTAEAVIYYRVGYDADARAIAEALGAPPDIITQAPGDGTIAVAAEAVSDGRLTAANVVVIIGNDNNIPVG